MGREEFGHTGHGIASLEGARGVVDPPGTWASMVGEISLQAHQDGMACQARPGTVCGCHELHLFLEMLER